MLALLRTMKEQWGSVDKCVIGLGLIDEDCVEQLRRNMVVDIDAISGTELDWMSHAELVARAEDEADRRIDALVAAA